MKGTDKGGRGMCMPSCGKKSCGRPWFSGDHITQPVFVRMAM